MPFGIGPLELIIVLVIILVIFGPKRLPQAGRALGQGMREFKDSMTGKDKDADVSRGGRAAARGGAAPRPRRSSSPRRAPSGRDD